MRVISDETLRLYEELVATRPGLERKGKTMPYTSVNGHMFSFLTPDGTLALRLPQAERDAFLETYDTTLVEQHGHVMREYVAVPAASWAARPSSSRTSTSPARTSPRFDQRRRGLHDRLTDRRLSRQPAGRSTQALERVRAELHRLVPDAEESIGYGMPVIKHQGQGVLWFAGWKKHLSIYPLTDSFLAAHEAELDGYERTKGSLHFTPDVPLPSALFEELVKARLADLEAGTG